MFAFRCDDRACGPRSYSTEIRFVERLKTTARYHLARGCDVDAQPLRPICKTGVFGLKDQAIFVGSRKSSSLLLAIGDVTG